MARYVNRVVPEKEQMQYVVSGLKRKGDQYVHNPWESIIKDFTFPLPCGEMGCTMHRIDSGAVLEEQQGRVMGAPSAAVDGVSYPYPYLDKCGPPEEATLFCGPLFAFTRFGPSLLRLSSSCLAKWNTSCQGFRAPTLLLTRYIITCFIFAIS